MKKNNIRLTEERLSDFRITMGEIICQKNSNNPEVLSNEVFSTHNQTLQGNIALNSVNSPRVADTQDLLQSMGSVKHENRLDSSRYPHLSDANQYLCSPTQALSQLSHGNTYSRMDNNHLQLASSFKEGSQVFSKRSSTNFTHRRIQSQSRMHRVQKTEINMDKLLTALQVG